MGENNFVPIMNPKKSENSIPSFSKQSGIDWNDDGKTEKNKKSNLLISVSGEGKVGKTRFIFTSTEIKNINLFGKNYGGGLPLYIIDLEGESGAEYDHHFRSKINNPNDVKIIDPRAFTNDGKDVDYKKSFENIDTLINKLLNEKKGTLGIDGFKFIEDCVYFILVTEVTGKGFNDYGKPNKEITPTEQVWKKKQVWDILNKLKKLNMPVIITNKVKKETSATEKFFQYTGLLVEDVLSGADYFYDIKVRLSKEVEGDSTAYKRVARITDSRFEEERVPVQGILIDSPSLKNVIEKLGGRCE